MKIKPGADRRKKKSHVEEATKKQKKPRRTVGPWL
jgi:hypothetical protein